MASNSQAMRLGYLLSPHIAFQGHAAHTARWPAMLSPNGSSGTCIPDGVDHIPMPCLHGATNPPVRTVREAFTSYGSRKRDITGRVHFANSTELFPVDSLTRSLATFVQFPYPLPQGLRHQSSSWCARLSRAQTP